MLDETTKYSDRAKCMKISYIINVWKKGKKEHRVALNEIQAVLNQSSE